MRVGTRGSRIHTLEWDCSCSQAIMGVPNTQAPSRTNMMQKGQGGGLIDRDAEGSLAWTHETGPLNPDEELGESRHGMAHSAPMLPHPQLCKAGGDLGSA